MNKRERKILYVTSRFSTYIYIDMSFSPPPATPNVSPRCFYLDRVVKQLSNIIVKKKNPKKIWFFFFLPEWTARESFAGTKRKRADFSFPNLILLICKRKAKKTGNPLYPVCGVRMHQNGLSWLVRNLPRSLWYAPGSADTKYSGHVRYSALGQRQQLSPSSEKLLYIYTLQNRYNITSFQIRSIYRSYQLLLIRGIPRRLMQPTLSYAGYIMSSIIVLCLPRV